VGADYFSTLRIPILEGREFWRSDNRLSKHVAIVSRSFASAYFGSQSPLGRHIGPVRQRDPADYEIVGVAADIKSSGLREKRTPLWYIPYEQHAEAADATFYVRAQGDPKQMAGSIRQVVRGIDARVPLYDIKTLDEQIDRYLSKDRILASGSTLFGVIAAILAAIGLYGVMSYSVATRGPEIEIRMALGAQRSRIIAGVMREVSVTLLIGLAIGFLGAVALGKSVASLLFGLQPTDAGVLLGASALMAGVAMLAGYVPAWRAAQIDPLAALRSE
jgi:predicted permease